SVQITADASGAQNPRVAARGGNVYVVWQDTRAGIENIFLALSHDGGEHFAEQRVSDNSAGAIAERRPVVAVGRAGDVFVAWQEFCAGHDDDCGRIKLARFDGDGCKLAADLQVDQGGEGVGKWNPALAVTTTGVPLLAWVDE